ncbi:4-aminobutyrate--pyruvate transaminase [Collimonas sp. PA-H2]|uniref:aminotransferase n=1 Tax=Collimonas sp. PA-H2 TaxID=1881062 RepID=UPI000BF4CCC1|nr:aminotransferase [Collimonas sp. PA-H2]PFH11641.1 4-aminobutyrate--pyruvate transaminase [Collimonas sp. PA-H2]
MTAAHEVAKNEKTGNSGAGTDAPALSEQARDDIRHHLHSQTNLRLHQARGPLIVSRGEGIHVFDEQGRKYIEGMSGLWCASLGFSNQRLVEAAARQLRRLPYYHTFNHRVPDVVVQLASRIAAIAPLPEAKVFFASSGSEAIDSMVKMTWYYQAARGKAEKRTIIAHDKGFHGSTVMGSSLSGLPHMHRAFGLPLPGIRHIECPHFYKNGRPGESEAAFVARLMTQLEQLIVAEGAETIAALISEPILGAGGVVVPAAGYFEALQGLLRKHDILLLADEIICGFGRTGNWFGAETMALEPDMMACAKSLSSGYMPISCVIVSGKIYAELEHQSSMLGPFGHGFTYSGHPVAAAVALEALTIYQEMDAPRVVGSKGEYLHAKLAALRTHPLVGEVRGTGLLAGVELIDKASGQAFPAMLGVGAMVEQRTRQHGLIVRNMGDAIALSPPFIISDDEIDMMVDKLTAALDEAAAELAKPA